MIYAVYIFDKALKSLSDKMAFYDLLFNTIVVQKKNSGAGILQYISRNWMFSSKNKLFCLNFEVLSSLGSLSSSLNFKIYQIDY